MVRILRFLNDFFKDGVDIGPVVIHGLHDMDLSINFYTERWGYVFFHPSFRFLGRLVPEKLGKKNPWYFFLSPDGTVEASTLLFGDAFHRKDKISALRRWQLWGHNFDVDEWDFVAEEKGWMEYMNMALSRYNCEKCKEKEQCENATVYVLSRNSNMNISEVN